MAFSVNSTIFKAFQASHYWSFSSPTPHFLSRKNAENFFFWLDPMALLVPVGCTRFPVPLRAHVYPSRRLCHTISATLSSRPKAVDWVEKTSSFFENDSRPIMLFDGTVNRCFGHIILWFEENNWNVYWKLKVTHRLTTYENLNYNNGK